MILSEHPGFENGLTQENSNILDSAHRIPLLKSEARSLVQILDAHFRSEKTTIFFQSPSKANSESRTPFGIYLSREEIQTIDFSFSDNVESFLRVGQVLHSYAHFISPPVQRNKKFARHHDDFYKSLSDILTFWLNINHLDYLATKKETRAERKERCDREDRERRECYERESKKWREEQQQRAERERQRQQQYSSSSPFFRRDNRGLSPYVILGITCSSQAKDAFKKLALQHHPDRFTDPSEKMKHEEEFKRISYAYDEIKRGTMRNWIG
jgi:hypothetical protein